MRLLVVFTLIICSALCATLASALETRGSVIEGTIIQASRLPDAATNPYPDCYFTAMLAVDNIVSGPSVPKKMILVLPGFFSRKYAEEAKIKEGDKIRATVVDIKSTSNAIQQTQQADDIADVDVDLYYPVRIAVIKSFEGAGSSIKFLEAAKPDPESRNPKRQSKARQEQIRADLNMIDDLLSSHGGSWDGWYESLAEVRKQYQKQHEAKASRWIGNSYVSAGYIDNGNIFSPEFVRSLKWFKGYLEERNTDLIVVRVPNKGEIVDDIFAGTSPLEVYNPHLLRLYKELLEADIEVVTDVIPRAKASRLKYPLMYWYQDFDENHPAEGIARVIAEAVADRLKRYDELKSYPKTDFKLQKRSTARSKSSYKWPSGNEQFNPEDFVEVSATVSKSGQVPRFALGNTSPALVVGSSFIQRPAASLGSNIPAYLAFLTGIVPDVFFRSGSDASIPRTIVREGDDILRHRTVCVFPIVPSVFYGALDLPPVADPAKMKRILLGSHAGQQLKTVIRLAPFTPKKYFTIGETGMTFTSAQQGARVEIKATVTLPDEMLKYKFFAIDIESDKGDIAVFEGHYSTQEDTVHKSFSQTNASDTIVFKTNSDRNVTLFIKNVGASPPTGIKSISFYGLE